MLKKVVKTSLFIILEIIYKYLTKQIEERKYTTIKLEMISFNNVLIELNSPQPTPRKTKPPVTSYIEYRFFKREVVRLFMEQGKETAGPRPCNCCRSCYCVGQFWPNVNYVTGRWYFADIINLRNHSCQIRCQKSVKGFLGCSTPKSVIRTSAFNREIFINRLIEKAAD